MRSLRSLGAVLLSLSLLLAGCVNPTSEPSPPPTPESSATPVSTTAPSETPSLEPSPTPLPTATPAPKPVTGYWIQNTVEDGLCGNAPRFVGFNTYNQYTVVSGEGASACYFGWTGFERWPYDLPSPLFGFPHWVTTEVPGLERVNGAGVIPPFTFQGQGVYAFAGMGGMCGLWLEEGGESPTWRCLTQAEGLPFTDIRGFGVVEETNAAWFMAPRQVASLGRPGGDWTYELGAWVADADARFTWMSVGRSEDEGIWLGTNGYGLFHFSPATSVGVRHTTAGGLPHDEIRDVQICDPDCVWVATPGGVGFWNGDRWRIYTTADGLPSDDVLGVSFDGYYRRRGAGQGAVTDTAMWAATRGGAAMLPEASERWQALPAPPPGIEINGVWGNNFSTRGQGLVKFIERPALQGSVERFTVADGLPDDRITALALTPGGLLVGTPAGAVEGEAGAWRAVTDAAVNDAASTALATDAGLWRREEDGWRRVSREAVSLVAEEGWYATPRELCRWGDAARSCVTTFEGASLTGIQALYAGDEDAPVMAVDEETVWTIESSNVVTYSLDDLAVYAGGQTNDVAFATVQRDPKVATWLLATPEGIYEVGADLAGAMAVSDLSLSGGWPLEVRQISVEERRGSVWIATNQGAFVREPGGSWEPVLGLPSRDITAIQPLRHRSAWIGTADAGLLHFVPEREP
ncbi:MAG: hypothetical protein ACLFU8_07035 [Anaerolineales bacterium]